MSKFFTILTRIGEAKLASAMASGSAVQLEKLAVGDGGGTLPTPSQTQTALVNEVRRELLNSVEADSQNPDWIICEQIIPENVGGWTIREVGLYDADGDLIAVGNFPETYKPVLEEGTGRTQTIRVILQISASASVEFKIDPSVVLATRAYVDTQDAELERKDNAASDDDIDSESTVAKHVKLPQLWRAFTNKVKSASTSVKGIVQLTSAIDSDSEVLAVTAKALKAVHEKLTLGFSASLGTSGYVVFPQALGGLIIQWGVGSAAADSDSAGYRNPFPMSFPANSCTCAIHMGNDPSANMIITARDLSSVSFQTSHSGALTVLYIAVGY
ncbi:phage tail protein [Vibrio sp. PP-XX7]